jgi:hypothetical protein
MAKSLKKGDRVEWSTSLGTTKVSEAAHEPEALRKR